MIMEGYFVVGLSLMKRDIMGSNRTVSELVESFNIPQLKTTPTGYKGCCVINPSHADNSPSMHIHLEKGHVKCFACGAYRSLFSFLMDNGATFDEAIEFMFIDHSRTRKELEGMQEYTLGRKIPKSMLDRGFTIETLKHFGVGYDEFKRRITIPLKFNGILYGINYRMPPKKIWSSEGFNKDNFIYNFEKSDVRILVEGFTDAWKVWQNGTKNVSATLMAYPSEGQLELLSSYKEIWLAYDNDKAGYVGAFRVHEHLGRDVNIMMIPYRGKDPDTNTKEEWERAIANRTSFIEFEVAFIKNNPQLYAEIKSNKY